MFITTHQNVSPGNCFEPPQSENLLLFYTLGIRYRAIRQWIAADILPETFASADAGNDQKAPDTAVGGGPVNYGQLCFKCSNELLRSGTYQRNQNAYMTV